MAGGYILTGLFSIFAFYVAFKFKLLGNLSKLLYGVVLLYACFFCIILNTN